MWVNPWAKPEPNPPMIPLIRRVHIVRTETDDSGTFGHLFAGAAFEAWSGELPWRKNMRQKSCIPAGVYRCEWGKSEKFGDCYHVLNVPDRDGILLHSANWMGNTEKGLKSQLLGCIALGRAIGSLVNQKALLSSRDALAAFVEEMDKKPFDIEIKWAGNIVVA